MKTTNIIIETPNLLLQPITLDYEYILYPVVDVNYASKKIPEFLGGKVYREYDEKNMNEKKQHLLEFRIYPMQNKQMNYLL